MRCPKTGFTPLKIASLVVGGIAIITHITAVAYPEWDGIDSKWFPAPTFPLPVKAYGSLWDFTLIVDGTRKMFYKPAAQYMTNQGKLCTLLNNTPYVLLLSCISFLLLFKAPCV